jgi:hypothetical protein
MQSNIWHNLSIKQIKKDRSSKNYNKRSILFHIIIISYHKKFSKFFRFLITKKNESLENTIITVKYTVYTISYRKYHSKSKWIKNDYLFNIIYVVYNIANLKWIQNSLWLLEVCYKRSILSGGVKWGIVEKIGK